MFDGGVELRGVEVEFDAVEQLEALVEAGAKGGGSGGGAGGGLDDGRDGAAIEDLTDLVEGMAVGLEGTDLLEAVEVGAGVGGGTAWGGGGGKELSGDVETDDAAGEAGGMGEVVDREGLVFHDSSLGQLVSRSQGESGVVASRVGVGMVETCGTRWCLECLGRG